MDRPTGATAFVFSFLMATFFASSAFAYTYIDPCGPTWDQVPVTYYVDESGTEQYPEIADLEQTLTSSFESWADPCCSTFDADYGGLVDPQTQLVDDRIVRFHDDEWPASYGGPDTLAVTLFLRDENCHIDEAPIHFNSAHHQFVDGDDEPLGDDAVDLEAVAAHEVGHFLGLGHSEFLEATMFGHYVGGTEPRTLHRDDVDGVCSLYTDDCPCTGDDDCRNSEICDDGLCTDPPCEHDDECRTPFVCRNGDCVLRSCQRDDDCGDDWICENERCVEPCPACRPCLDHADCGHQGYCRIFPHGGSCMIPCTMDGNCPGDSVCTAVEQGRETFPMCTAPDDPDHPNEYCPVDYVCDDDGEPFEPCPGLGDDCSNQNFECAPHHDVCLEDGDELLCSCSCLTDADCGAGHLCIDTGDGQSACLPNFDDDSCREDADCSGWHICQSGTCVVDDSASGSADPSSCTTAFRFPPIGAVMMLLFATIVVFARRLRPDHAFGHWRKS